MVMIRPSSTLVIDIDERLASKDTIGEIKRNYAHIGTPVIRTHAPESDEEDAPYINTMRMMVKMGTYKYLYSADEGADERWNTIVEPWVRNMLHKVGNNMMVFNKRQRKIKLPELVFQRMTIEFQGGAFVVGLHTDAECLIDRDMNKQVGVARALLNDGTFEGVVRVDMPTDEEYATQHDAAYEPWLAEHPQPEPEPEDEAEPEPEPEPEPQKTREELLAEDIIAKSYENTHVPPTDSDTLPPIPHEEEVEEVRFNFEVDYHIWKLTYQDGSTRTFDSQARAFLD